MRNSYATSLLCAATLLGLACNRGTHAASQDAGPAATPATEVLPSGRDPVGTGPALSGIGSRGTSPTDSRGGVAPSKGGAGGLVGVGSTDRTTERGSVSATQARTGAGTSADAAATPSGSVQATIATRTASGVGSPTPGTPSGAARPAATSGSGRASNNAAGISWSGRASAGPGASGSATTQPGAVGTTR